MSIGTGSYTITTLGDARVMTFNNLPIQAASLTYTRAFVERGGAIYFGYQSKPTVSKLARLNSVAANAFLTQLGVTAEDPSVPLALTATSYQGTWDVREASSTVSPTNGTTVFINADGTSSCLIALAASTIFSMPGCEQPTTMTMPSGVSRASESSRNSSVPGLSETSAIK